MIIYNLTNDVLSFNSNGGHLNIAPRTKSNNLVITRALVQSTLLPLIRVYGEKILLVPNDQDSLILSEPGCGVLPECITDNTDATSKLHAAEAAFRKLRK